MTKKFEIRNSTAEFLTFVAANKEDGVQVFYKDETIWATQQAMAQLFNVGVPAIIAVGYRVSSMKATRFRQWATSVLNSYIRKGFALDDDRLKELGGGGYWKELLLRIRDIRWECLPYRNHFRFALMVTVTHSSGFQPQQVLAGSQYLSNRGRSLRIEG